MSRNCSAPSTASPLVEAQAATEKAAPATDAFIVADAGIAVFWMSIGLLFYVYVGYPVLAVVRARVRPAANCTCCRAASPSKHESPSRTGVGERLAPRVSIVVVAYNEASSIEARLENLLALDYPADRFEILVGSDGSTDDTVERARRYQRSGVRVQPFTRRRGKPAVLNALVAARVRRHRAVCRRAAALRALDASRDRRGLQ
jgi:hypothetical protein